jgi:hypothetical protein
MCFLSKKVISEVSSEVEIRIACKFELQAAIEESVDFRFQVNGEDPWALDMMAPLNTFCDLVVEEATSHVSCYFRFTTNRECEKLCPVIAVMTSPFEYFMPVV